MTTWDFPKNDTQYGADSFCNRSAIDTLPKAYNTQYMHWMLTFQSTKEKGQYKEGYDTPISQPQAAAYCKQINHTPLPACVNYANI